MPQEAWTIQPPPHPAALTKIGRGWEKGEGGRKAAWIVNKERIRLHNANNSTHFMMKTKSTETATPLFPSFTYIFKCTLEEKETSVEEQF